jgi:hypothetical protein
MRVCEHLCLYCVFFKSEFYFLFPKINFVPLFTQFNKNSLELLHLTNFFPLFTLFYILPLPTCGSHSQPDVACSSHVLEPS